VQKNKGQWYIHTKIPGQSQQQKFHKQARALPPSEVKENMWKAKVGKKHEVITITGKAPIEQPPTQTMTEEEAFELDWGITNKQQGDPAQLEEAITTGVTMAVSNGSLQDSKGLAAWTIKGKNQLHHIPGLGRTPGEPEDHSAYRSKLFGLWGIFQTIQKFIKDRNITMGHVWISCNGILALQQAQLCQPGDPAAPHYDLIVGFSTALPVPTFMYQ